MRLNQARAQLARLLVGAALLAGAGASAQTTPVAANETVLVRAAGFALGGVKSVFDGTNRPPLAFDLSQNIAPPFSQAAVKQDSAPALLGPDPEVPYFTVRFALPVPPENAASNDAALLGLDPAVFAHNHSPGFEILPNGDALAVFSSTPPGESDGAATTTFIQARLRYGSEQWDLPELFFDCKNLNDQSALLWNDHGTIRFFGGGGASPQMPFKMANSTDSGATWTLSLPQLDKPAENFAAQPVTSAFRGATGAVYFAMDGDKAESFLWRSADNGIHWQQMAGRTGARQSAIVPLDDKGSLLSIGGEKSSVGGWSPENFSTNWGASWSSNAASPFPPLGGAQRPSLIKLADGNLFFVSDAYRHMADKPPPDGWNYGPGAFVALSTNNGTSWRIKPLPVQLPDHERQKFGTVGEVTARQAPNGVIHLLTTATQPCLHYELNEAWILSGAGDTAPETGGGHIQSFREDYPSGKLRALWSARICPDGRYLLFGLETDYYESGPKQHEVAYVNGRKTREENFWAPDGKKIWSWSHDLKNDTSVWTQYWPNGQKKSQSTWNTQPTARDLARSFFGLVADGPVWQWDENGEPTHAYDFTNGVYAGALPLPKVGGK